MAKLAKRLCVRTPAKAAGYFGCWWKFNHPSLTEQFSLSEQLVSCFSYWNALGREALHLLQFAVHWPWLAVHVCHWCLLLWCLCALVHGSSERPPGQTRWWLGTSVTAHGKHQGVFPWVPSREGAQPEYTWLGLAAHSKAEAACYGSSAPAPAEFSHFCSLDEKLFLAVFCYIKY